MCMKVVKDVCLVCFVQVMFMDTLRRMSWIESANFYCSYSIWIQPMDRMKTMDWPDMFCIVLESYATSPGICTVNVHLDVHNSRWSNMTGPRFWLEETSIVSISRSCPWFHDASSEHVVPLPPICGSSKENNKNKYSWLYICIYIYIYAFIIIVYLPHVNPKLNILFKTRKKHPFYPARSGFGWPESSHKSAAFQWRKAGTALRCRSYRRKRTWAAARWSGWHKNRSSKRLTPRSHTRWCPPIINGL